MAPRYNPTPDERRALEALAEEVAGVQRTFVANHPGWRSRIAARTSRSSAAARSSCT